jgi:hypothetical protein
MAVSTSRLAYSDCFDLLEQAINDEKGIRVKFASYDDAFNFRLRLHQARKIDRQDNLDAYAEGHRMHGHSVYDPLSCKIRPFKNGAWLLIERVDARVFEVESLTEEPSADELPLEAPPPLPKPEIAFAFLKNEEGGKPEAHMVMPIRLKRRI